MKAKEENVQEVLWCLAVFLGGLFMKRTSMTPTIVWGMKALEVELVVFVRSIPDS